MDDHSPSRLRDRGAAIMLAAVCGQFRFIGPVQYDALWEAYLARLKVHQDHALKKELVRVRFAIAARAGRDADWIRSMSRHGVPPLPD